MLKIMNYKNIAIVTILCKMVIFCSLQAMDVLPKKDHAMEAVKLINEFLLGKDKKRTTSEFYTHLERVVGGNSDDSLQSILFDDKWVEKYNQQKLLENEEVAQKLKQDICALQNEEFICKVLENDITILNSSMSPDIESLYRKDITTNLPLLSNFFPYKKNKISVFTQTLNERRISVGLIKKIIDQQICTKEPNIVERAYRVSKETDRSLSAKREELNALLQELNAKKPDNKQGPLLLSLWEQDNKDFQDVYQKLEKVVIEKPSDIHVGAERHMSTGKIDLTSAQTALRGLKKIHSSLRYFEEMQKKPDGEKISDIVKKAEDKLNRDVNKVVEYLISNNISSEDAFKYFDDPGCRKYFSQFLRKKSKNTQNYFKYFDEFLRYLKTDLKKEEIVEQYKKILYVQGIIAIASSVTSDPSEQQINYFSKTENLEFMLNLENAVIYLNAKMYDSTQREKNIQIISNIQNLLKGLLDENYLDCRTNNDTDTIAKITLLIELFKTVLTFDKKAVYEIPYALNLIALRIGLANKTDLAEIEKIGKSSQLTDFFNNTFPYMTADRQREIQQTCVKIKEELSRQMGYSDFPIFPIQKQEDNKSAQQLVASQMPAALNVPQELEGQDLGREVIDQQNQANQQIDLPMPVVPAQQAPIDEPGFIKQIWNGLRDTVWTGITWVWQNIRAIFGGFRG